MLGLLLIIKSKRYINYEKLEKLINVEKNISFVSVLVDPDNEYLEKIKKLNFDYYQLYDVDPKRTREIKNIRLKYLLHLL